MKLRHLLLVVFFGVLLLPSRVSPHGVGEVYKLPIPLEYYLIGAALTVAISFFALSLFSNTKIKNKTGKKWQVAGLRPTLTLLRIFSLGLFLLAIATGLLGTDEFYLNFASGYFWIFFFIGNALLSGIVSNAWRKLSPWQVLVSAVLKKPDKQKTLPSYMQYVPLVLFVSFTWWELVSRASYVPFVIGSVLFVYTVFILWVASTYARWQEVDVFSRLYGLIGNIAPFQISDDDRQIILRRPSTEVADKAVSGIDIGLLATFVAQASFDSIKETVVWSQLSSTSGLSVGSVSFMIFNTLGLVFTILIVYGTFRLAVIVMRRIIKSKTNSTQLAG